MILKHLSQLLHLTINVIIACSFSINQASLADLRCMYNILLFWRDILLLQFPNLLCGFSTTFFVLNVDFTANVQ